MNEKSGTTFGYHTADGANYKLLRDFTVKNRKNSTEAESLLWNHLRAKQLGYRFRRQHIIGDFIVDFLCRPLNLVIEVDGGYHFEGLQQQNDAIRTDSLESKGFHVLRFTNEEVMNDIDSVVIKIKNLMEELPIYSEKESSDTTSLGEGRGKAVGKVLIVCAPSGTGKSTIIHYLQSVLNDLGAQESPSLGGVRGGLSFSISATTRAPRGEEHDGVEYFFLTEEEFQKKIDEDAFIEWEQVYAGQKYGTLKEQVEGQLSEGHNIVFDVDVNGGLRIKDYFKDRALALFILPPSIEALRERLEKRGTETPEKIQKRLDRAEYEISRAPEFDRQIVNDDLATAEAQALEIVSEFLR